MEVASGCQHLQKKNEQWNVHTSEAENEIALGKK